MTNLRDAVNFVDFSCILMTKYWHESGSIAISHLKAGIGEEKSSFKEDWPNSHMLHSYKTLFDTHYRLSNTIYQIIRWKCVEMKSIIVFYEFTNGYILLDKQQSETKYFIY